MFLRIVVGFLVLVGLGGLGLALIASLNSAPAPQPVAASLPAPPPPAPVVMHHVITASRAVRAGTLLLVEDLATRDVAEGDEPAGSFPDTIASRDRLRGAMVRRTLNADEIILSGDVLRPGDRGFLAAVLRPGMRAITVGVDPVSGTAGLIWPGDRVDLVLTQTSDDKDQPIDRRVFSETVLSDVRVIAVDQQMVQGGQGSTSGGAAPANRTVTLEASPFDAEKVTTAARLGKLSLVVRSAAGEAEDVAMVDPTIAPSGPPAGGPAPARIDAAAAAPVKADASAQAATDPAKPAAGAPAGSPAGSDVPIAWGGDVSPALRDHPGTRAGSLVRVYSGPKDQPSEIKF
jgi:pilus assembly protein CpaB